MSREHFIKHGIKGFGLKPMKLRPETAARWAVSKHKEYLRNANDLKLLLLPIGKKKDYAIVNFLYGNADATMEDLVRLTEGEEALTPDALRQTIKRLNDKFFEKGIPLKVEKEPGNKNRPNKERVWLDARL